MLGGTNRTNAGVVAVVCLLCLAPVAGAVGATGAGGAGTTASVAQEASTVTVTDFSVPSSATLHRNFTVEVTVNNTGSEAAEKTIHVETRRDRLWSTVATHNVTVPANTETTVSFNVSLHEGPTGENADPAVLRVGEVSPSSVTLMPNGVSIGPSRTGESGVEDTNLAQGENTTVTAHLRPDPSLGTFVVQFEGGTYATGDVYTAARTLTDNEPFKSVTAHPRFDAGGTHAVTASGQFLDFVTVSSPNVSVTNIESLPAVVYEGTRETLNVTVENTGGRTETFAVTTSQTLDGADTPARVDTRVVSVAPGETRTVPLAVAFHERGQQTLAVNNDSGQTVTVRHPVEVTQYGVAGDRQFTAQNVTLTATVTNHRSTRATRDVEFSLWNSSGEQLEQSLNETKTVTLAGGETKTVTYRAFVLTPGTYDVRVGDTAVSTVEVTENPISVTGMSVPANASAGSQVDVTVTLANDGETDTHRNVMVSSFPWFASQNVSVPAGETRTVTFSRTVTTRGFVPFSVQGNRSAGAIVRVPTPNLTVSAPLEESYEPLRMPGFTVALNNTGSTTETYLLPVTIEHDAFAGVNESWIARKTISPGGVKRKPLFYETSQPGNYTLTVRGHLVREFTVTKPVETVTAGLSNATVKVSEPVAFNGTYRNPTNETQYVPVTVDGTDRTAETVPANETANVSRTFTFAAAGTYTVVVNGERYDVTVEANDTTTDPPTDGGDSGSDGDGSAGGSGGSSSGDTQPSTGSSGSSTGDSSDSESSDDAATNGTDTGTSVVTVNATTTANGTAVAEASGSANQTVAIVVAGSNATDGDDTAVTGVNVTLAENETFTVSVSSSDTPPASLADTDPDPAGSVVEYVNISHPDLADDAIASASFTVTIGAERLAAMDAAPGDVVAYRYDDGWERVETTYRGRRGDAHAFEVDAPGLSVFAVGVAGDPDGSGTTEQSTTARSTTPQSTTEDASQSTTEAPEGTTTGASGGTIPGFGVGAALVAVLGALLAAGWTRRD